EILFANALSKVQDSQGLSTKNTYENACLHCLLNNKAIFSLRSNEFTLVPGVPIKPFEVPVKYVCLSSKGRYTTFLNKFKSLLLSKSFFALKTPQSRASFFRLYFTLISSSVKDLKSLITFSISFFVK